MSHAGPRAAAGSPRTQSFALRLASTVLLAIAVILLSVDSLAASQPSSLLGGGGGSAGGGGGGGGSSGGGGGALSAGAAAAGAGAAAGLARGGAGAAAGASGVARGRGRRRPGAAAAAAPPPPPPRDCSLAPEACSPLSNATRAAGAALLAAARRACARHDAALPASERARVAAPAPSPGPPPPAAGAPGWGRAPGVSVIVGTHRAYSTLGLLAAAVRAQVGVAAELVVVDAGSWPPVIKGVPGLAGDVDALMYRRELDGRPHRARNLNEAANLSRYDTLLVLDDDTVPAGSYWALAAVHALAREPAAALARLPTLPTGPLRPDLADAPAAAPALAALDWAAAGDAAFPAGAANNVAVRRAAWDALGGFAVRLDDEPDGGAAAGGADFLRRAAAAGLRAVRAPAYGCALRIDTRPAAAPAAASWWFF